MMSVTRASDAAATPADDLKGPAAGFGLAAAIAILFNSLLAWEPLNAYMVSLGGDFWRTHGVAAVVAFFVLGYLFTYHKFRIDGFRLAVLLAAASIVAGGGLALWFALV
jgi:hypothetical protein